MSAPDLPRPQPNELFDSSLELVETIARQVARSVGASFELAELVSFGREGLLLAARRFDPSRGVPFRVYASFRIRGAILDEVRRCRPLPRRVYQGLRAMEGADRVASEAARGSSTPSPELAEHWLEDHLARLATAMALGLLPDAAHADDGGCADRGASTPEAQLERAQLGWWLREQVAALPAAEARLLERHYFHDERFDVVARELGLSKSWASRLHARAIERLTKRLRQSAEVGAKIRWPTG